MEKDVEKFGELLDRQVEIKEEMEKLVLKQGHLIQEFRTINRDIRDVAIKILQEESKKETSLSGDKEAEAPSSSGEAGGVLS